jgi:hypothetical protein
MKNIITTGGIILSVVVGYLAGKYAIIECQLHSKEHKEKREKENNK